MKDRDKKDSELVSVIIPVYNVAQFLPESLESALNQTYHNLEIIIVNDGSTDGSDKICDEYARKDKRIQVFHQCNNGLSCARNKGLDVMTGGLVSQRAKTDKTVRHHHRALHIKKSRIV